MSERRLPRHVIVNCSRPSELQPKLESSVRVFESQPTVKGNRILASEVGRQLHESTSSRPAAIDCPF